MPVKLNADLGESWYEKKVGDDDALMPYLDLCNIACGFHGGDTLTIYNTIELAEYHQVAIGAHPSFPDRKNFGRIPMRVDDRLFSLLLYQVGALNAIVSAVTNKGLHHVKPHGALYHYANQHPAAARAIVRVSSILGIKVVIGPPKGELKNACEAAGLTFMAEGFADRAYEPTLHLRPRQLPNACLERLEDVAAQTSLLAREFKVRATDGKLRELKIDTLCLHGDHPGAGQRAKLVREILNAIPPR